MTNKNTNTVEKFINTPAAEEVSKSFLEYSMSVVYSRALVAATDGLKPVQRRILYAMSLEGMTHDKNFVKATRPVASTMGNFHPHGDSSIFEALVKLVQPFYLNIPLVEGYGNFGDISGSGAAAPRYVECRLSKAAQWVLQEVKEDTVDMRPNYDGETVEPVSLPVMFPNLLINGNFGIAVGFASKFAPHNPGEAIDACKFVLKNPDASLKQIMKYIPGPDFPTGAEILGTDGIEEAYSTGQGVIRLRSRYTVQPAGRGKSEIVFTELPYGVKTESVIAKIKDALKAGKLQGLADVKDLTDRKNGLRVVVETKTGINPQALLVELFKNTPLEESFGINNTALVDGEPRTIGLKEIITIFLDYRKDIVLRRTRFRINKRETRKHLVEGLLKALANIDEVIRIVRASADASVAQAGLMKKFKLDEIQADYILGIPLRRLTKYDQIELKNELKKLIDELKELNLILKDEEVLKSVILAELDEVKKAINRPRLSTIVGGALAEHLEAAKEVASSMSLEVADEPCGVFLTPKGGVVRSSNLAASKPVSSFALTTTRGKFIALTNKGRAFRLDALHVGEREVAAHNVLPEKLKSGEKVVALAPISLPDGSSSGGLAVGTKKGVVKVVAPQWPVRSDDFTVMGLDADDEIIGARWVEDVANYDFVFIASNTNLLRFEGKAVRPQGLSGAGVAGVKLVDGSHAISFNVISKDEIEKALVITTTGKSIKATPFMLYPAKGRASQGMRSHKFLKGENELVLATVSPSGALFSKDGKVVTLPKLDTRRDGSGVKVADESLF